jgi:hypothetical protein
MTWLKNVVVDLAIMIVIVLATTGVIPWTQWVVFIYTPFMLALKALAFFGGGLKAVSKPQKQAAEAPPALFFHALYAVNVAVLALSGWWLTAAQWALIWVLSSLVAHRGG